MANPTRFPSGVSTEAVGTVLGNLPVPAIPENGVIYFNDFQNYVAGDWTVIAAGSGTGTTINDGTAGGGSILLTWGTSGSQANTLASKGFRVGTVPSVVDVNGYVMSGSQGGSGTASFATTVMNVTNVTSGAFAPGQLVVSPGVAAGTTITTVGTGRGGVGTYNLSSTPGTIGAQAVQVLPVGGQTWFEAACVGYSTIATPNYQIGLIAGTGTSVTDGIYFTKAGAASTLAINLKSASSAYSAGGTTTIALPNSTLYNGGRFVVSFYYDGKPTPTLWVYVNDLLVGTVCNETIPGSVGTLGTRGSNNLINLPFPSIGLAPSFLVGTGGTLEVDYVVAASELNRF